MDTPPQVGEGEGVTAGIEPAAPADQLGGADACTWSHTPIKHQFRSCHSRHPLKGFWRMRPVVSRHEAEAGAHYHRRQAADRRSGPTIRPESTARALVGSVT
ncbi:hypothetical protein TPA0910_44940 [Streptomyces hygroscopicus subsp. sporocinereus]|uniref:Uncharacterized protein n=1 Tax=Streptomyces hygroscopicus TaxID=1912 RepID=A0ABQ3U3V1_STRHY|nr:hypothetical protein TPA0910_44940 [Streptomyces hygroscopicus]